MADGFEEKLADEVRNQECPAPDLGELRKKVVDEYARTSRKVLNINLIAHCALGFFLCFTLVQFTGAGGTKAMLQYSTLAIITCMGLVVMKLWYWIVVTKLDVLQELKLMRLREEGEPLASPEFSSYIAKQIKTDPLYSYRLQGAVILSAVLGVILAALI